MAGLLERIAAERRLSNPGEQRYSADTWLQDYLWPSLNNFGSGGLLGLNTTFAPAKATEITGTLPSYTAAVRQTPPAFAAQMIRALVLSQARFVFRNHRSSRTPRRMFGTSALGLLEKPWQGATTGELIARMEWHAGLAGNSFVARRSNRLRVLRPDWTAILYGSELEPDDPSHAIDGELIGYAYCNGGFGGANTNTAVSLLPGEVAHWSPLPDPLNAGIGMSWITPAIRDMQGDQLASQHKIRYFENGATPNLVVKGLPATSKTQFDELVDSMEERHTGTRNAYRTLYLTLGADATVVGSNLKDIDLKSTQGSGETRISALSRVPAPILGISEGLGGSSLNAGNFGMARRNFADTWVYPSLTDLCASLANLVNVPGDAELWFDTSDIPLLREDGKDAAEIMNQQALTIEALVRSGYEPASVVDALQSGDLSKLRHTGLYSVQLQPPGTTSPAAKPAAVPDAPSSDAAE